MRDSRVERGLWSVEDVARFLGVSVATVYGLRYRREGPAAVKVGRELRFDPAEVRRWVAARIERAG